MSYDIHVTRKAHWSELHGPQITKDEWCAYVEGCADLRWMDTSKWTPGDACAELLDENGLSYGAIWWANGELTTRRPESVVVLRAMSIAKDLRAITMGDDHETYVDTNAPSTGRPAYYNPDNLTNEWEEPPIGYEPAGSQITKRNHVPTENRRAPFQWTFHTIALAAIVVLIVSSVLGNLLFSVLKFILS